jgi:ribosomal protein L11 methyltransferase
MENNWTKVDIFTTPEGVEPLSFALSELGHQSLSVVDSSDLEKLMEGKYGAWDYIDPELMKLREAKTTVSFYVEQQKQSKDCIDSVEEMLMRLKKSDTVGKLGSLEYNTSYVKDENWADSWKENYAPIVIGEKLVVCPSWMDGRQGDGSSVFLGKLFTEAPSDAKKTDEPSPCLPEPSPCLPCNLIIDPGMAFGTGLDETTRLCLEVLESTFVEDCSVLDIGCGSGILAIAALLLGAKSAFGVDIDEVAVKTAKENAEINGVSEKVKFTCGNPVNDVSGSYDIVCANISADVILLLTPEFPRFLNNGGLLILSGIVETRKQEIVDALLGVGLSIVECKEENGWTCVTACPDQGPNLML